MTFITQLSERRRDTLKIGEWNADQGSHSADIRRVTPVEATTLVIFGNVIQLDEFIKSTSVSAFLSMSRRLSMRSTIRLAKKVRVMLAARDARRDPLAPGTNGYYLQISVPKSLVFAISAYVIYFMPYYKFSLSLILCFLGGFFLFIHMTIISSDFV
jgi:hypothetical protein